MTMNSRQLALAENFKFGRISAREFSKRMARIAIRKNRKFVAYIPNRNDRRYT